MNCPAICKTVFKTLTFLSALAFTVSCSNGGSGGGKTTDPGNPPTLTFAQSEITPGGTSLSDAVIADFNHDGKPDLAVAIQSANAICVYLNQGNGGFGSPVTTTVGLSGGASLGSIATGDFNEDSKPDLVLSTVSGSPTDVVLLGNGDGTFAQQTALAGSTGFLQARVADINGDNHQDIVTASNGSIAAFLGNGTGAFSAAAAIPNASSPANYVSLVLGDFTGDNKLDIAAVDLGFGTGSLVVYPGNGNGTFGSATVAVPPLGKPASISAADFNGDGKLDIVIGYNTGFATAHIGNGNGTFALTTGYSNIYSYMGMAGDISVVAAEIDASGKPDIIVADATHGRLAVIVNSDNGAFADALQTPYTYGLASGVKNPAIGLLNSDSKPDIAISKPQNGKLTLLLSQ